jgi:hypothetical protein
MANDETRRDPPPVVEDLDAVIVGEGPGGTELLGPHTLLVALDETGHEELADPRYPIFGMGGCVIPVRAYWNLIHHPWLAMKQRHFGDLAAPLHAVDVARAGTPEQKAAIGSFFARMHFPRVASLLTERTRLELPVTRYDAVMSVLTEQIAQIARLVAFDRLVILLESSERGTPLAEQFCRGMELTVTEDGVTRSVPTGFYHTPKSVCMPALEVADFIMHAAGTATRMHITTGRPFTGRRDFDAVFNSVRDEFAGFFLLEQLGGLPPDGSVSSPVYDSDDSG